jgi:hypothetical protein
MSATPSAASRTVSRNRSDTTGSGRLPVYRYRVHWILLRIVLWSLFGRRCGFDPLDPYGIKAPAIRFDGEASRRSRPGRVCRPRGTPTNGADVTNPPPIPERIENSVDWFESNPTGGGATALPFREVAKGMWLQNIQYGTGNALTVDTGDGLLQVDTGIASEHAKGMITSLREATDEPVTTIVYSHGHTAYNHGVEVWLADSERRGDPRPTIIAHRNVLHRLRRYRETQEYLERVTEWQFGFPVNSIVGTRMFEILMSPTSTR